MPLRFTPGPSATLAASIVTSLVLTGVTVAAAAAPVGERQTVIVEFDGEAAVTRAGERRAAELRGDDATTSMKDDYRAIVDSMRVEQNDAVTAAGDAGIALDDARHVTSVLNAVVATVDVDDLDALRALPGVARVTVDTTFRAVGTVEPAPTPAPAEPSAPTPAPEATPAPPVPSPAPEEPLVADPPVAESPAAESPALAPLPGDVVVVAILDTGVDYTHPELGGAFGTGHLVVDGYDFVNDDADPMDDHYHGTHVAGIVAGSTTGVAPGVQLTAYKVLNNEGEGFLSGIVLGLDAAADPSGEHPADIVNMSLGGVGDGTDPLGVAAGNATASGALVVAAAGNSGPGEATVGSPAAASAVLAVGASVTDFRPPAVTLTTPQPRAITASSLGFSANGPAVPVTARVVDVGRGTADDFAAAGSVRGAIVVFDASVTPDHEVAPLVTAQRAESLGALGAFVYVTSNLDQSAGDDGPHLQASTGAEVEVDASSMSALASGDDNRLDTLVAFSVSASEYRLFAADVAAGTVTATVTSTDANDRIASFSSRGPTSLGALKPEVVAPGFEILSAVPLAQGIPGNAYRLSGTSMAAPYVAGAAALLAATHPQFGPVALRELVIGSAVALASEARNASPSIQGAGRVRADATVGATVSAAPATLGFGQADARKPAATKKFTLTNTGDETITGAITVEPSASSRGTLTPSVPSVSIAPGEQATVSARATADVSGADSELSGSVVVSLDDGSTVRIPFLQLHRTLSISSTPNPSTGLATVFVDSFLPLDTPPVITVTPARGKSYTVKTARSGSLPGSYSADISEKRVGVYALAASSATSEKAIVGSGTLEIVASATSDKTWQQLGRNGSAWQVAVSTKDPGTAMQVVSTTHRPFVTRDRGKTWTHLQSLPVAGGEGRIVADPTTSEGFWYFINGSSGRAVLDASYTGKLLRTDDLGETWRVLGLPDVAVRHVASDGNRLAAITKTGVEVSRNGGKSFTHLDLQFAAQNVVGATIFRGDLYAVTGDAVWRVKSIFSRPGTPEVVRSATEPGGYTGLSSGPDIIAVGGHGDVSVSTDGDEWKRTSFDSETWVHGLTVLGNEILVSGTDYKFRRSADRGKTWTEHDFPTPGGLATHFSKWPDRKKSLLIPLGGSGLWMSGDDGAHFTRVGAAATSVHTVIAGKNSEGDPTVVIGDDQGVGSAPIPSRKNLRDDAAEWGISGTESWIGEDAYDVAQDAVDPDSLWRTRDLFGGTNIQASTDAGAEWTDVGPPNAAVVYDIAASPTVGGHVAASVASFYDRALVVTHDGWTTWETYSHPITIRRITIDPTNNTRLWVAADDGLYVSHDDGRTITRVLEGETGTVWVNPDDADHIVAGGRGLWVSHDGGATFATAEAGGADMYTTSITSTTVKGKKGKRSTVLFAGSSDFRPGNLWVLSRGVLASVDNGDTWHNVTAGIGSTSILSLDTSDDGEWLMAGTRGGGLYRADVGELVSRLK